MRLYLAGPMTGYPAYNFAAFHEAAARLRAMGFEVWSPAEKDLNDGFDPDKDEALPLREYMKVDLPAVLESDAVAVLTGWQQSRGAALEVFVADYLGMLVLDAETGEQIEVDPREPELEELDETVLEEAQRLVYGDREASYGHPADDFARTAQMWSAILAAPVSAKQAALCMCAVKISREVNAPKRDNLVDLAGYAAVASRIVRREAELE